MELARPVMCQRLAMKLYPAVFMVLCAGMGSVGGSPQQASPACVAAPMAHLDVLVEVMVTAAKLNEVSACIAPLHHRVLHLALRRRGGKRITEPGCRTVLCSLARLPAIAKGHRCRCVASG